MKIIELTTLLTCLIAITWSVKEVGMSDSKTSGFKEAMFYKRLDGNKVQCRTDQDLDSCINCEFYSAVRAEEGKEYIPANEILAKIKN